MSTTQNQPSEVQKFDMDDPLVFYIGRAPHGTATSIGGWLLTKIDFDASGNPTSITTTASYSGVWDDRLTETYG